MLELEKGDIDRFWAQQKRANKTRQKKRILKEYFLYFFAVQ